MKTGSLTPSRWLQTSGVTLNTVRWSGTFLCGVGQYWSVEEYRTNRGAEILEKSPESQKEEPEVNRAPSPNWRNVVDVFQQFLCVWAVLTPHEISVMVQADLTKRMVSLRLWNDSSVRDSCRKTG